MTMFPPGIQRVGPVKRWPPQKVAAVKVRLEKARKELLATLETLRGEMLTQKEADAVEAAIEDELIPLRVGPLLGER
jgi:hypothetical protein